MMLRIIEIRVMRERLLSLRATCLLPGSGEGGDSKYGFGLMGVILWVGLDSPLLCYGKGKPDALIMDYRHLILIKCLH